MYNRKLIFASACAGLFLFGVGAITLGSIAPDLKTKFALDELGIGRLFSLFPVGILVGSLSFGLITDRFGYKLLLAVCSLLLALGFAGIGLATVIWVIQVCILLIGVGGGAINGATSALVADISEKNKGASLALFGVFFGLGALAMPFVLGLLRDVATFEDIVLAIAALTFLLALVYFSLQFPVAKQAEGISLPQLGKMLKDPALLLIGFFLFWQSACEALINNWTTSYLIDQKIDVRWTLYALTSYVAGLSLFRLLTGSVFRNIPSARMLGIGMGLLIVGALILGWVPGLSWAFTGLILVGFGLALGFPVMFGLSSSLYSKTSGTAIGIILAISLIGNLLTNFLMGYMAQAWGIGIFSVALLSAALVQAVFCFLVFRK
ncbi:MFS transporter [Haliscomenobacter hydrossis]|uniref:Major facilitator superfamily MFS_1 n=1 Tax=Haliscomenobacter hydrossis (strain ATCC 27775 / DSM 1100 / LMG 10767 / O) TaxID=760192 RepID=F4KVP1_HALH1|nr:MFS transporter [Haliscomenobacter hydrossis]AEE52498.1 major facilitator superfamily MFS_1 [Haliscomenobacter hydrossis DSM 1100]